MHRNTIAVLWYSAVLLLGACAANEYPTTPPDSREPNLTWAQKHYIQKMKYQQMTNDRLS